MLPPRKFEDLVKYGEKNSVVRINGTPDDANIYSQKERNGVVMATRLANFSRISHQNIIIASVISATACAIVHKHTLRN